MKVVYDKPTGNIILNGENHKVIPTKITMPSPLQQSAGSNNWSNKKIGTLNGYK